MSSAGRVLRRGASEVRVYIQANPYSVTLMSFFGGCWLMLASALTILNPIKAVISPLTYILQFYQVFFGLIIVVVDGPAHQVPALVRGKVLSYASFMHNNVSRTLFYLFIGCQQGCQEGWWNAVTGYYFAAVAAGYALLLLTSPPQVGGGIAASEGPTTSFTSAAH